MLCHFQVHLEHGDFIETKIPKHVKNIMQMQANEMLDPQNLTNAINFLLYNYYNMLTKLNNVTSPEEYYQVYHSQRELSFGVFTVMILVGVLSAIWVICIFFMVGEAIIHFQHQMRKKLLKEIGQQTNENLNPPPNNSCQQKFEPDFLYTLLAFVLITVELLFIYEFIFSYTKESCPIDLNTESPIRPNYFLNSYAQPWDGGCRLHTYLEANNHFALPWREHHYPLVHQSPYVNNLSSGNNKIVKKVSVSRNQSLPPSSFRWLAAALLKGVEEVEDYNEILIERF